MTKLPHKLIRNIIKWSIFTIFIVSVIIKLKNIIIYGGKVSEKTVTDPKEFDNADD